MMKKIKRWAVCIMCISMLFSLFGCGKGDRFILDGPGMVNTRLWKSFSVSRSGDSYAQYNFAISVTYDEEGYIANVITLDGEEQEFVLPSAACCEIDKLNPHGLPDLQVQTPTEGGEEEPMILDAPSVQIEVTYNDGTITKKTDCDDFSIQVYRIVMPYSKDGLIE